MARAGAVLFAAGGSLALLSLVVPHWHIAHPAAAALVAALALPMAALLYGFAERVPARAVHFLVALASVQLAVGVYFLRPGAATAEAAWGAALRDADVLARPGGDEFGVVLPNCAQGEALHILDRLRKKTPDLTFSAGLACWDGSEQATSLMQRADIALYRAKNRGGN